MITKGLLKLLFTFTTFFVVYSTTFAVECISTSSVQQLKVEGTNAALIMYDGHWHRLTWNFTDGTGKVFYATALAAFSSGAKIAITYPDPYNCGSDDYMTAATSIRIINNIQ